MSDVAQSGAAGGANPVCHLLRSDALVDFGQIVQAAGQAGQASGGMDALDKGVDGIMKKAGHGQSRGTTEKISDGIRSAFKKMTGRDVPIKDQNS